MQELMDMARLTTARRKLEESEAKAAYLKESNARVNASLQKSDEDAKAADAKLVHQIEVRLRQIGRCVNQCTLPELFALVIVIFFVALFGFLLGWFAHSMRV